MRIVIGIPCYQNVSAETLEDYMRLAYYCGRRMPQHEFVLAIKSKSEQFRARNAIVEGALQLNADYLFFLDDDHVIDWETTSGPNSRYGMVQALIDHLENDPEMGICGVVYYHRGAQCRPVLMKKGNDGGYYWLRDDEVRGELQEVAVQGGGCMMLKMSMFDKIQSPWFEPEFEFGTDVQICKKASEAGYKVCCDTSIQIGHVLAKRDVVTPNNRHKIAMENAQQIAESNEGLDKSWMLNSSIGLYRQDAEEYLGCNIMAMSEIAQKYNMADMKKYKGNLEKYYATRGREQLARQVLFHHTDPMIQQMEMFHNMINTQAPGRGIDVGCGSAPVTFELALRGHHIDFIDIDGAGAYEFTKWRAKKRNIDCGFEWNGPYDYAFMLDSIEHMENWQEILLKVIENLKEGGALITNFFFNNDFNNPEHVNMDHAAVKKFLTDNGVYPLNDLLWTKKDLGYMDREAV